MPNFAEVILPLPLRGSFTYSIPDEMAPDIQRGSRVYVQFGKKKHYTGIVIKIHTEEPKGYQTKPILILLDEKPIVRHPQLKFWLWVAEYYLCSIGEVYKAAVPSGLKIESESYVVLNSDYDLSEVRLTEKETQLLMALENQNKVRVSDLEGNKSTGFSANVLNKLIEKGIVIADEALSTRYRPKKVSFVKLSGDVSDQNVLHAMFDMVQRSLNQERLLISILDLTLKYPGGEIPKNVILEKDTVSPAILKALADKGIVEIYKKEVNRFKDSGCGGNIKCAELSPLQQNAYSEIKESWKSKGVVLLRGVTGSGKTEIYCHAIAETLRAGHQALYLVPEISLTSQLTDRLRKVFGDRLFVYHSKFSDNERVDTWKRLLSTHEPLVVLGVRSSVFLPFSHLGVVIVDEEHESSYKQFDPAPRYNARDAAIMLATMHGAKTLLGSATPSIETYSKALNGKYGLVKLLERYEGASLPSIEIVDMKEQRTKKKNRGVFSSTLLSSTKRTLENGHQVILFQNRRGFAPTMICRQCSWQPKCINCDVSMVYHKQQNTLSCHYCGYTTPTPSLCPACGQNSIEIYGFGTERIEEETQKIFPDSKVTRMDYDTTRNRNAYHDIIDAFARHETDILIGTQMVSKGLDFGKVKTVGVMNADSIMNFPDFRAHERAFNMMVQVAGRAGRRDVKGDVLIQTLDPQNPLLAYVKNHDYDAFYEYEIAEREKYAYPPFTKIIIMYLKNKDEHTVNDHASHYAIRLRQIFGSRVLGPVKPSIGKVANYHIQTIMLKIESNASMSKVKNILFQIYEEMARDRSLQGTIIYYDVDPV